MHVYIDFSHKNIASFLKYHKRERFAGNFHGFQEYHERFFMNIYL